jgi:hypothetical protein
MSVNAMLNFSEFGPYLERSRKSRGLQGLSAEGATIALGFHVYLDLRLTLDLRAAGDTRNATKYLRILELYTNVVAMVAAQSGGHILEAQGERIHVLINAESPDESALKRLLSFAHLSARLVYTRIKDEAGDAFQGLRQAADHGTAILVVTGSGGDDSVVSLGPCANAPAKRLGESGTNAVPAGHLSIPRAWLDDLITTDRRRKWLDINVLSLTQVFSPFVDAAPLHIKETVISRDFIDLCNNLQACDVRELESGSLLAPGIFSVDSPLKLQAVAVRADLDGFTAKVAEAFRSVNRAKSIVTLVSDFLSIVATADSVLQGYGRPVIQLPWAGDCANALFLPKSAETYDEYLGYASVDVGSRWHSQKYEHTSDWEVKWALGVAGGDDVDGAEGRLLVATIPIGNRSFLVGAGWGMGRSLDAQNAEALRAGDTAIPSCDFRMLDTDNQKLYRPLTSLFHVSGCLREHDPKKAAIAAARGFSRNLLIPSAREKRLEIPKPRPYLAEKTKFAAPKSSEHIFQTATDDGDSLAFSEPRPHTRWENRMHAEYFTLSLAKKLQNQLLPDSVFSSELGGFRADGMLPLGQDGICDSGQASVAFIVPNDWHQTIPLVICKSKWLRSGNDWHAASDGTLCIEFPAHWQDEINRTIELQGWSIAVDQAALWVLHSTVNLLQRHLIAYRLGLKTWPSQWTYWPHKPQDALQKFNSEFRRAS